MKTLIPLIVVLALILVACDVEPSQQAIEAQKVDQQQQQYAIAQPVPVYDWSLERDLLIQLYNIRNDRVATHSVWRSDYGIVEGDCPSMGYGIPYDTSLTNPWLSTDLDEDGWNTEGLTSIGQPEPNGVFASTNTAATWVMCLNDSGLIEPHYVETKVTVYPYAVSVDYENNIVTRAGEESVTLSNSR